VSSLKQNSCFIHLCRRLVEDKRFKEVILGSLRGHSHLPCDSKVDIFKKNIKNVAGYNHQNITI
jgi:hypothetical protein